MQTIQTTQTTKELFDSAGFAQEYHTIKPLGAFCAPEKTVFRIWSPVAQSVILNLYNAGTGENTIGHKAMKPETQGTWSLEFSENLHGIYYDFSVSIDGVTRKTPDPCARACGLNGKRSMVIDLSRTNPIGWLEDVPPPPPPETIIYEVHTKDFSFDPASGIAPSLRGKFLAFCQNGTTLDKDGKHPTGLDYMKQLGVTHIQLMPSFDFGSVDENGSDRQFNWGYDPVNYNIPEGSYSTDPCHGEVRIRELKQAVQALHQNGFRVILDVVYNHTYSLDSPLFQTIPWYFYRQNTDGSPANGSGCGNDTASERSMCARYILDSVLYWAEEYHIDGFRFDLMGLLDVALMNRIQNALDQRFGAGEKLLYGEPWSAMDTAARPGTILAHKQNLRCLQSSVGAFCDATRDAVKGGLFAPESKGFANGGGMTAAALEPCLKGWAGDYDRFSVQAPSQTITYLSCHDDWTLWDKLVFTLDKHRDFAFGSPAVLRANRLAAVINFCCQGHLFLLAGEEFGRTKQGLKNTYDASPELNCLDWRRAWKNRELVDYYRGLIALRKQLPGLCDKSEQAKERFLWVKDLESDCVAALIDNSGDSPWDYLFLVFNAENSNYSVNLPDGQWECLTNGTDSFLWQNPACYEGVIQIDTVSAAIFGQRSPQTDNSQNK